VTLGGLGGSVHAGRAAADAMVVSASTALNSFQYRSAASSTPQLHNNTIASVFSLLVNASLLASAALTGKHDTLVRRAPGWQGAPDGQQAKN